MKEFKLNAIVALILGLGIACSGSAFAAKTEVKTPTTLRGGRVPIIVREVVPKGYGKAAKLRGSFQKESQIIRCIVARDYNPSAEPRDLGKLIKSSVKCNPVEKDLDERIVKEIDEKLKELCNLMDKSSVKLKKWEEMPLNAKDFIAAYERSAAKLLQLLRFCEEDSIVNGLRKESDIFSGLINICLIDMVWN